MPTTCLLANGLIVPADAPSLLIRPPCIRQCRGALRSAAPASCCTALAVCLHVHDKVVCGILVIRFETHMFGARIM